MKKYIIVILTLFLLVLSFSVFADNKNEYSPNVYYEHPKPAVRKKCTPCVGNVTSCRYAAWYGRFEPEGRTVYTCNEFDECSNKVVPKGGRMYEYFKWVHREHVCW